MGTGQFRPADHAKPHIGSVGAREEVEEAKVKRCALVRTLQGRRLRR